MKITYAAAVSSDGFIAREDGDVAWLDEVDASSSQAELEEFFRGVGGLVMGRKTYDFVFNYGSWPYEDKPTWVCTSRQLERINGANLMVTADIQDVLLQARQFGIEHLWLVGGGELASSFVAESLLTHVSLTQLPVVLGSGIPLFANHNLDSLPYLDRHIVEKGGCKRIEIVLRSPCSDA